MSTIDIRRSMSIAAPADIVRDQFGDVAHHAATHVHRGVRFELLDEKGAWCHYRQVTRFGPIRLTQEFDLERVDDGPLVNTVTRGQFTGGTISFDIEPDGAERSTVEARLEAEVNGLSALAAPLLRSSVKRAFDRALAEDRDDLESGTYRKFAATPPDHR